MKPLEQVFEVGQPITTALLQGFDFVVEAFEKATGLSIKEIIGDLLEMIIQGRQEFLEALDGVPRDERSSHLEPLLALGFRRA